MVDNKSIMWEEYFAHKTPELREKLITEYAYLVKYAAARVSSHVGSYVEFDDLVSYGIFGLIDAIDKFDINKNVKFETYATLRIRGEIIDNIRKMDWVPRSMRQKNKMLEQAISDFEAVNGRVPTEEELAVKLNMKTEEVRELIKKSNISSLLSLDDYLEQNHEKVSDGLISSKIDTPEQQVENKEIKRMLVEGIKSLSEKQRQVITLYYYEELTLKEISKVLGVSESRVSQIHSNAVKILKTKLGKNDSVLFLN